MTNSIDDFKERVINFYSSCKKKDDFIKKYSPWHNKKGEEIISKFVKKDSNFSWLNIYRNNVFTYSDVPANIHYGVPNQVIGDFDGASLFLCLSNPNIGIEDSWKSSRFTSSNRVKRKFSNLSDYYKEFYTKFSEDASSKLIEKEIKDIKDYIVNTKDNILFLELKNLLEDQSALQFLEIKNFKEKKKIQKKYYYLTHYFYKIVTKDGTLGDLKKWIDATKELNSPYEKLRQIKICNIESFPFRSQNPSVSQTKKLFGNQLIDACEDVTLLSSRIILRRIALYYLEKNNDKPIFIFRRFNDLYKESFTYVLKKDLGVHDTDEVIKYFEKEGFFYYLQNKDSHGRSSGIISQGNLKTMENKCLSNEKFTEIFKKFNLDKENI